MKVDASEGVARVIFENSRYLGIEMEGASPEVGDVITVKEGDVQSIVIYNGAETGPLTFDISFSGAYKLLAGAATMAAVALSF